MPITTYDAPPIRSGAAPTLNVSGAGLDNNSLQQPAYLRITGALVGWMRYHFGLASRIEFPNLVDRLWNGDAETSTIWIGSLAEWKPTVTARRPGLLIDRLDQDLPAELRAIGEQRQGYQQGNFGRFMTGLHVIHCLGGREGEAEILAAEVWRELVKFAPVARQAMCLLRFLPHKIGRRVSLEEATGSSEAKQSYAIPLMIAYGYDCEHRMGPIEAEITAIRTAIVAPD